MTPKSLLRHKQCVSSLDDLTGSSTFHRVIEEHDPKIAKKADRIVICSGKVYYDLLAARDEAGIDNISIIRLEQIYPFPHRTLQRVLSERPDAEIVWCQEEPRNMGSWDFVDHRIEAVMRDVGGKHQRPIYAGRPEAASPATGSMSRHLKEQNKLIGEALKLNEDSVSKVAE